MVARLASGFPRQFMAMCEKMHITGDDLRKMADFLDAHSSVEVAPAEVAPPPVPPEASPEQERPVVVLAEQEKEQIVVLAEEGTGETEEPAVETIVETEEPVVEKTKADLEFMSRGDLVATAKRLGIPVAKNWGRRQIIGQLTQATEQQP